MTFAKWLDTFLSEKGIDAEEVILVEGAMGENHIPIGVLADHMKGTSPHEQKRLKAMFVKIDFVNGNVRHFLAHLAQAVAL
jgi:hypothetical protein